MLHCRRLLATLALLLFAGTGVAQAAPADPKPVQGRDLAAEVSNASGCRDRYFLYRPSGDAEPTGGFASRGQCVSYIANGGQLDLVLRVTQVTMTPSAGQPGYCDVSVTALAQPNTTYQATWMTTVSDNRLPNTQYQETVTFTTDSSGVAVVPLSVSQPDIV